MTPYISPGITKPSTIINMISEKSGMPIDIIKSKSRKRNIVEVRQLCMYFIYKAGYTLKQTGLFFKKDHATVIHACKTINNLFETNKVFIEKYKNLFKD